MIPYGRHHIDEEDIQAVANVLGGGVLTQGPEMEAFEQAVAEYVGAKYAIAVSNGAAGPHLAALAAGSNIGHPLAALGLESIAKSYDFAAIGLGERSATTVREDHPSTFRSQLQSPRYGG